jgi:putative DNA primase/helicase
MSNIAEIFGGPFDPSKHERRVEPPEVQLRTAMQQAGIKPPKEIVFDGALHRFATGKKAGDLSGWYVAHGDKIPAGAFGDWREGVTINWRADIGRELTVAEQMAHSRRLAEIKKIRERELAAKREDAADRADDIWSAAALATDDHPYLLKKGVKAHDLRVHGDGRLIAPVWVDGALTSLQFISGDGSKMFLTGGQIKGGFHVIGNLREGRTVYLCEGVATGLTIHEATGEPVVMAFSAGNLLPAGLALRELLGVTTTIVVIADNDESGTGQRDGAKAAEAIGARMVMPPVEGMDVNDYAQSGGDLMALLAPPVEVGSYLINADEFASHPQPVSWIIKRWMPKEALCMIHGPSGSGKTFVVLDMMLHVAAGLGQWNGYKVNSGPVVYLAGEGHQGLRARIAAWKRHNQVDKLNMWLSRAGTDLNTPDGYQLVLEAVRSLPVPPVCIIVDTLHRFLAGDENSAQDAKTMIDACVALSREFGCSVVLVHHTGVSEEAQHRARGSSAWRGALDAEFSVVAAKEPGDPLQFVQRKQKDAELAEPMWMRLTRIDLDWIDEDGERVSSAVATMCDPEEVAAAGEREGKVLARSRKLFEDAFFAVGKMQGGRPFLSASAWNEWTKTLDWQNDGKRRKELSQAKKVLLDADYMSGFMDGYRVENQGAVAALSLGAKK